MPTLGRGLIIWTGFCLLLAALILGPVALGAWPPVYAAFVIPVWFLYLIGLVFFVATWFVTWFRTRRRS
jgi:hypothetical protein